MYLSELLTVILPPQDLQRDFWRSKCVMIFLGFTCKTLMKTFWGADKKCNPGLSFISQTIVLVSSTDLKPRANDLETLFFELIGTCFYRETQ